MFGAAQTAHAAVDVTLTAKSVAGNSVTLTVKNNGQAGTDAFGSPYSVLNGVLYAVNMTTNRPDNSTSIGPIVGGQSRDVTIANLNPMTGYSIEFQEGGLYNPALVVKKITMYTQQGTVLCAPPKILVNGACVTAPPAPAPTNPTPSTQTSSTSLTTPTIPAPTTSGDQCTDQTDNQIGDGKDYGYGINNGDRKADRYGTLEFEPDPACFAKGVTIEKGDDLAYNADGTPASVIPCTNKCTLNDVFRLLNNIIAFFFKVLLIPIFVIMIIYAGYKYIAAQGNSAKIANLKRMLGYFIGGIILILCAWLIVRTIMNTLLNDQFKQSGVELLGE
jgi:hypothetical protein